MILYNVRRALAKTQTKYTQLEMWANAQSDVRPAEYRWRPLFNAAVWLTPTNRVPCSNAAKTRNLLKFAGVPRRYSPTKLCDGAKMTIFASCIFSEQRAAHFRHAF